MNFLKFYHKFILSAPITPAPLFESSKGRELSRPSHGRLRLASAWAHGRTIDYVSILGHALCPPI